jgi:Na+/H+ antiporter NhaD/arsenite permease-like protein
VVDNVPLVVASMGMYEVVAEGGALSAWDAAFVKDGPFWQFLAFCAGTGGSMLIIGSAAGVAVMGLEKIDFMWYVRRVSGLAVLSYLVGALSFWLMFG